MDFPPASSRGLRPEFYLTTRCFTKRGSESKKLPHYSLHGHQPLWLHGMAASRGGPAGLADTGLLASVAKRDSHTSLSSSQCFPGVDHGNRTSLSAGSCVSAVALEIRLQVWAQWQEEEMQPQ